MGERNVDAQQALPVYSPAKQSSRQRVLLAHMHRRAEYNAENWLQTVTQVRGRNLDFVSTPWMCLVVISTSWTAMVELGPRAFSRASRALSSLGAALSVVESALAFLVIFRLARAAQRYWEARQAAGRMIASCRSLASTATAAMGVSESEGIRRWIAAFPVATKNYLRGERGDERELDGLLADPAKLLDAPCQPTLCVDLLRGLVIDWARRGGKITDYTDAQLVAAMLSELDDLTLYFGAMERINNTPLPFVYVAHLRVFLLVFLLALPFVYASSWKWGTPFVVALIGFALLGVEAAAVECERPFARDPNHFALELFCVLIDQNLQQTSLTFSNWHDKQQRVAK